MRIVFAGTPEFVLPVLETIKSSEHQLVAIYTAPDKPAGRGLKISFSAVKDFALYHNLPLEQPQRFDEDVCRGLAEYNADIIFVMAYGFLLPASALTIPKLGCVNCHLSLLPRWRGAAPVVRAIEAGDEESGICLIKMTEKLDAGPIILKERIVLADNETSLTLYQKLSDLAISAVDKIFLNADSLLAQAQDQDDSAVTYARKIDKREAQIDWHQSAEVIERKIRAFNPWPVAQTQVGDLRVKVWQAIQCVGDGVPGDILNIDREGIVIACKENALQLKKIQPQNSKKMSAYDFANGHQIKGKRFC